MGDIGPPPPPPPPPRAAARQPRAPAPAHPPPRGAPRRDGELPPPAAYGYIELEVVAGIALCCLLGTLLLCNITGTAAMAVRRAFGRDSLAAAAAREAFVAAVGTMLYFAVIALIAQILKIKHQREIREALIARARRLLATGNVVRRARRRQDPLIGPVTGSIYFVSCSFMVVAFLMLMFAPANSYQMAAGYLVAEIGWFVHSVAFCFILCAAISAKWRSISAQLKNE